MQHKQNFLISFSIHKSDIINVQNLYEGKHPLPEKLIKECYEARGTKCGCEFVNPRISVKIQKVTWRKIPIPGKTNYRMLRSKRNKMWVQICKSKNFSKIKWSTNLEKLIYVITYVIICQRWVQDFKIGAVHVLKNQTGCFRVLISDYVKQLYNIGTTT